MYWFRLGNKVLIACGGLGWPPKKTEKHIDAESKAKRNDPNMFVAARLDEEAVAVAAAA